jgi:arylsulfatase B
MVKAAALAALWLGAAGAAGGATAAPPHIIFALTDDLGWNFPGYHHGEQGVLHTPTLDALAAGGVRLESSYMYKYCSPSRGSLLTGRYPWKLASTRCNFIPSSIPEGVDLGYTMLPKHLAKAGYISTHIGKWHLGFHAPAYTPVARGFNQSFGFLEGGEDHWTHACGAGKANCHVEGRPPHMDPKTNWDLWSQSTQHFPGGPVFGINGTEGDLDTYSGYVFTEQAVEAIASHDLTKPLFMFLSLHNTHAPVEAPERFVDLYDTGDALKDTFFAMVSVVDETMKNVTDALKSNGMWENSIVVWTTDNGSPVQVAGSNHPLKGGKSTNWEGGVRTPAFVTGGRVPSSMRGKQLHGLVHVSDWFATFSDVAGLGPAADPEGVAAADSISQWKYISGQVAEAPRTEIVHDHRMFSNASRNHNGDLCNGQVVYEKPGYDALGAIRMGDFKLIVGDEHEASWFGEFSPNASAPRPLPGMDVVECARRPCLFNIVDDPSEHKDLAAALPHVVTKLWARFNESNAAHHPAKLSPPRDVPGFCGAIRANGGWVAPWL